MSEINRWVETATQAASEGRWQDAEQAWHRVISLDPKHPQALYSLGVHAFQRGRLDESLQALRAAQMLMPGNPMVALSIARVMREKADVAGERAAIESALAADAYYLPALLAKADLLERVGQAKAAVTFYRNALKVAAPEAHWPQGLRDQLKRATAMVRRYGEALSRHLADGAGTRVAALTLGEAERWREAGALLAGHSQPYPSICNQLQVPRLPAIPFFDRSQFEWVEAVEASTAEITAELHAALAAEQGEFRPYVAYAPGVPLNQWRELNHSQRWTGYFLWNNGTPVQEHIQRCPRTAQVLEAVGQPDIPGMCPNAMFSALAPHTHIPPHTGDTNARLVVHLPLVVPEGCRYRVGYEHRRWKVGEVLIFDDSIEHEARNDSDELRVVLIFDVWNPLLSEAEREMVRYVTAATREFTFSG